MLNLLLALICYLETAFGAFKTKKLDRFVLDLVIVVMIVMGKDEMIVDHNNHPVKEILKDSDHGLMEAETGNGNTFLHET